MLRLVSSILAVAGLGLSGCWLFGPTQHPHHNSPRPPADYQSDNSAGVSNNDTQVQKPVRRRVTVHTSHPPSTTTSAPATITSVPPAEAAPVDGAAAVSQPTPSLTLSDEDSSKATAERLLDKVDRRLASINRSKLSPPDAATYDEANGFASSARRALAARDYVVASGLAEKASALSGQLGASASR